MAKKDTEVKGGKAETAVVDGTTGEVEQSAQDIENALLAQLSDKSLEAALAAAEKAKPEEFKEEAQDFWKPSKPNDSITGVYMSKYSQNRYAVHVLAVKHPKTGKPMAMRINGSRILSKEMAKGEFGKACRIVYEGETKTEAGQKLNKFRVYWLGA